MAHTELLPEAYMMRDLAELSWKTLNHSATHRHTAVPRRTHHLGMPGSQGTLQAINILRAEPALAESSVGGVTTAPRGSPTMVRRS